MDKCSLSLKLFKNQKGKTKGYSLFLKRIGILYFSNKGQILMEGLFVIICLLSFLSFIQFFQSLTRKEIQKERLTKQKNYETKKTKAPWYKPVQGEH